MTEAVRDVLRGAMRPLSPEAVLVLGFPGMLIKTRNTQVREYGGRSLHLMCPARLSSPLGDDLLIIPHISRAVEGDLRCRW